MQFNPEKKDKVVYIIGALKNKNLPKIANQLRKDLPNFEFFNSWYYASDDADHWFYKECKKRGFNFKQALNDWGANHVFHFDKFHIERADILLLLAPAGKSGHLELGYGLGIGKPGYIYYPIEPQRMDIMLQFATDIIFDYQDLVKELKKYDKK